MSKDGAARHGEPAANRLDTIELLRWDGPMAEMYCFSCRVVSKPRTRVIDVIAIAVALVGIAVGIALQFVERAPFTRRSPHAAGVLLAIAGISVANTLRNLSSEYRCGNCDGITVGRLDSPTVQRELKSPTRDR